MKIIRNGTEAQYGPRPTPAGHRRRRLTPAQSAILDHLVDQPEPCTVTALAEMMHQHPNTVREHLDALVAASAATRTPAPTTGRGRPAWLYEATIEARLSEDAQEYASLAAALAGHIARTSANPAADADAAGMEWGRDLIRTAMASGDMDEDMDDMGGVAGDGDHRADDPAAELCARRRVVTLLDELGFSPEADDDATVIRLRRCPLLAAAHLHPEVVCGVHLGLAQGALAELGAASEGLTLLPFAERGACRLHLTAVPE
ncbi:transcriptional regulator [Sanguibacter gelidistatuariae]|uniref:Transcriptional regulator n=1 Tax=Sanguibacter gelidistatuariae TaxID=1814289 RepID=A0A1G6QKY9_9MICO|nr:MarR family transcriptional regulator [Sanguibacter gelidistatuariae]SDC92376.1 transcriptional regulator [Sanguibacter gelidistatuariae]